MAQSPPSQLKHSGPARPRDERAAVAVVVPVRNDEAALADALDAIRAQMCELDDAFACELIVIDDASTDGTAALARDYATAHAGVRVIEHLVESSAGGVLRSAFTACATDYIVVLDVASTYGPEHLVALLRTIDDTQARVVIASPYMSGGSVRGGKVWQRSVKRAGNWLLSVVASGRLHTLTEPVRAYDAQFVRALNIKAVGDDVHTEVLYKAQLLRAQIVEVPADLDLSRLGDHGRPRAQHGFAAAVRSLLTAFLFRPFAFFIVPGALLLAATFLARLVGATSADHSRIAIDGLLALGAAMILFGIVTLQAKRYHEELFHLQTAALRHLRRPNALRGN
jgi:glycosyltransferase involved in cell wall biosynthesis